MVINLCFCAIKGTKRPSCWAYGWIFAEVISSYCLHFELLHLHTTLRVQSISSIKHVKSLRNFERSGQFVRNNYAGTQVTQWHFQNISISSTNYVQNKGKDWEKKFGEYETEDRGIQDSEPTVDFFFMCLSPPLVISL